jgi:ABC-2 type transport system ATP-binding protein
VTLTTAEPAAREPLAAGPSSHHSAPATTAETVLHVRDAAKHFGTVAALEGATFELKRGELLGLLGPNGAGKTTLIRALTGRVKLDRGAIETFGRTIGAAERREQLGAVPQEIALYPMLNARENLEVFGRLHGVPARRLNERVTWALEWTSLSDRAREPVKRFSGGMKRRLNIACGVLHEPRIVLLDEPTVGVDPQSRERIYDMLGALRADGTSLLLTTHQLEEAEGRCDRIAILDHGRVVAIGKLAELVERTGGSARQVVVSLDREPSRVPEGFERLPGERRLGARVSDIGAELPDLIERVRRAGLGVEDVEVHRRGLNDVFLHLTGKELRE